MLENENTPANDVTAPPQPAAPALAGQAVPPPSGSTFWGALSWVRDLVFSVLIAVILIVFIYQPVKVEGTSMMPTLTDQERIFINKFTYHYGLGGIERGDMVVFKYPLDTSKSYIKRVVGVPGDVVKIVKGQVYVNDVALAEDYVPEEYRDHASWTGDPVPKDKYFVLGDHRSSSNDSRAWGWVDRKYIYGKAVFVYWPLEKLGRLR
jgi:signal peptidase I